MRLRAVVFTLALVAITSQACAQPAVAQPAAAPESTTAPAPSPAPAACCVIPMGTVIYLELTEEVGSKVNRRGDRFGIRLSDPIRVDGRIVVPAGVTGAGEVVDAARAGMGGKPGELVLAARYITFGGAQIPLRSFKLGGHGLNNSKDAQTAVLLVGVVGLAMRGGDLILPVGAEAQAKIASNITLPPAPAATVKPPEANPPEGKSETP